MFLALVSLAPASAAKLDITFVKASTVALENPHDLKLSPDGKYLFVSDVGNNRVVALDPGTLAFIAAFGDEHQAGTHDIDFDAAGRAYIADTHNNRVTIYEMKGVQASLIGQIDKRIRGPEGVLAHPNGLIYVAGAWSGNVVAYRDGEVVAELKGLSSPHDVERAPNGDIWLADTGNNRMLLLTTELKIVRELKGASYNFSGVRYQDVLPNGTLIAADKYNHQVKVIGTNGQVLLVLGTGEPGKGPGRFTTPEGVEVQGNRLWISDSGNDRVVQYRIQRQP
ncbi:hypothetical protein C2W62_01250 [Candidatus Entotheonella serta]|nr:hypothetical protein C2W62_01250 [Candidatus Entotheonella serta]